MIQNFRDISWRTRTKGELASGTDRGRTRRFRAKLWVKLTRSALFCISRAWRCMDGPQGPKEDDHHDLETPWRTAKRTAAWRPPLEQRWDGMHDSTTLSPPFHPTPYPNNTPDSRCCLWRIQSWQNSPCQPGISYNFHFQLSKLQTVAFHPPQPDIKQKTTKSRVLGELRLVDEFSFFQR